MDLLVPSDKHTTCPYKGEASYWSVQAGGKVAEDAVWSYPEPLDDAPPLAGHFAFYWDKMDEWLEEDEPAIVHARDPYHRVDVLDTSRHVRVSVTARRSPTRRARRVLFETGLPPRWYFPREDVRMDLLNASDTRTGCAYKGFASYWSVGDEDDLVWSYPDPRPRPRGSRTTSRSSTSASTSRSTASCRSARDAVVARTRPGSFLSAFERSEHLHVVATVPLRAAGVPAADVRVAAVEHVRQMLARPPRTGARGAQVTGGDVLADRGPVSRADACDTVRRSATSSCGPWRRPASSLRRRTGVVCGPRKTPGTPGVKPAGLAGSP